MIARSYGKFVAQLVLHPRSIAAVAPTSRRLARRVVSAVDWGSAEVVLEYGAGTGAVTQYILPRLRPDARFVAIEINPRFAAILRQRFPGTCVCQENVAEVKTVCEQRGLGAVDTILSGLPWSFLSDRDQTMYLNAMMSVLKPAGQFVNFGYLPALLLPGGKRFRRKLHRYFGEVRISKPVWTTVPPAFIYCCRR